LNYNRLVHRVHAVNAALLCMELCFINNAFNPPTPLPSANTVSYPYLARILPPETLTLAKESSMASLERAGVRTATPTTSHTLKVASAHQSLTPKHTEAWAA